MTCGAWAGADEEVAKGRMKKKKKKERKDQETRFDHSVKVKHEEQCRSVPFGDQLSSSLEKLANDYLRPVTKIPVRG